MLRFTDPNTTPPGGFYTFRQKESGYDLKDVSLNSLIKKVKIHRQGNNIPIGVAINEEVEAQSCREILEKYPNYSGCVDDNGVRVGNHEIGIGDVHAWGQAMIQLAIHGFCEPEEAERRAAVCAVCPKNKPVQACWGCKGVSALMDRLRGDRRTKKDSVLEVCTACKCINKNLVHFPDEAIDKSHSDDLPYEIGCWIPPLKAKLRG